MTLSMDRRQVIKFRFSFFVSRFNSKSDKFALRVFKYLIKEFLSFRYRKLPSLLTRI